MQKILFFFDFMSPYAYLAAQRLPRLAERHGREIEYCPINLPKAKLAAGNTGPANRDVPAKHKHLRVDLQRWAKLYEVPLVPPASYGSDFLNRGTFYAIDRGVEACYIRSAWHLVWGCGGGMDDPVLIGELCSTLGWDLEAFTAFAGSTEAHERYAASQERAHRLGVFGVPMICVDGEMWWGNDRLHFVENFLSSAQTTADRERVPG
jgi:2-hydroxychromene-2-carboxylate isomerase